MKRSHSEAGAPAYPKGKTLKKDHISRPIWVTKDLRIFLEAFSPYYQQAYDFLVAVAEPVSRPEFLHEYKLTAYSLFAAVAVGLDASAILKVFSRLCKTPLPDELGTFVEMTAQSYGQAKLVLRQSRYFIEARQQSVLQGLMQNPVIGQVARLVRDGASTGSGQGGSSGDVGQDADFIEGVLVDTDQEELARMCNVGRSIDELQAGAEEVTLDLDHDIVASGFSRTYSFEIPPRELESVKREASEAGCPLMEEYDFKRDDVNSRLDLTLKPSTKIRKYQEKSLRKMFGNGRARSGVIVLPCGAGKTLTGVTAAATVQKSCIVLCTSVTAVNQWKAQFRMWTTISDTDIACFTREQKFVTALDEPKAACVLITTYSMMAAPKRSDLSEDIVERIKAREWGLMLLDEVHVVPANTFRKVIGICKAHCKLGLTATLVREDDLISDLNFLIGPKLYEANWRDLTDAGFLASVQCMEVWCQMTREFFREYLKNSDGRKKRLLYVMNPNKFRACEHLKHHHEARGDKIMIFSDDVFALKRYAKMLNVPCIYGDIRESERNRIFSGFRHGSGLNTIAISKVGDVAIDLPEANVIIQVSSHFGSRRQEAQRLGRILRPKQGASPSSPSAYFYTLVSIDTQEMFYSTKRQQYLVDQGYSFRVMRPGNHTSQCLGASSQDKELDLLREVLCSDTREEAAEDNALQDKVGGAEAFNSLFRQTQRTLEEVTGADGVYMEFDAPRGMG